MLRTQAEDSWSWLRWRHAQSWPPGAGTPGQSRAASSAQGASARTPRGAANTSAATAADRAAWKSAARMGNLRDRDDSRTVRERQWDVRPTPSAGNDVFPEPNPA